MNTSQFLSHLQNQLDTLKEQSLFKHERNIASKQAPIITTEDGKTLINLCANNYLNLANDPRVIEAAHDSLNRYGYGMASVRFICGTQTLHKELEHEISSFLGTEDTILYSSCFDANGGLFETILNENDAIISDSLNHASIIDGIRLCKAKRFRYKNNDMNDLEEQLKAAQSSQVRLIATDGVFSMDGYLANLPAICELAKRYNALVMVDDSHATGFMGKNGKGTPEHFNVTKHIDIFTGTLGKALGGASGGYTSGRKEIIAWLRQRSRPYLFSNSLAPVIAGTSLQILKLIQSEPERIQKLHENSRYFRSRMMELGFEVLQGEHPIIPIMTHDAGVAARMSEALKAKGVYVIGFSYPVVPQGQARIRTQMNAGHDRDHLDTAIHAFSEVKQELLSCAQ